VTIVDKLDRERVLENVARRLEPDAMLAVVGSGFLIVLRRSPVKHAAP
jgi:hypothetical protein